VGVGGGFGCTTVALEQLLTAEPVEIVLFDGQGPSAKHPVWRSGSVNVVVWNIGNRTCHPPRDSNWVLKSHSVQHSSLGGATQRWDTIRIAVRFSSEQRQSRFELQPTVSVGPGCLERVVDRKTSGRVCLSPRPKEQGSMQALIDTKLRDKAYVVPSVFSPTGYVR